MMLYRFLVTVLISGIIVLGVYGAFLNYPDNATRSIELLIGTITLTAVIAYVYFTYLISKEAWEPVASFSFRQYETDPLHIQFILTNHSKVEMEVWGELIAYVMGKEVRLSGFYAGKRPWILQPLMVGYGNFGIEEITGKAGTTLNKLVRKGKRIDFTFKIKYRVTGRVERKKTRLQKYYFDPKKKSLVLDV